MNSSVRSAIVVRIAEHNVNKHEGMVLLKLNLLYSEFQGTENFTKIFKATQKYFHPIISTKDVQY
jgi:hypothetical protein